MKIDFRTTFEVTGLLAVVISLLFVAYQIQQANRIARVTTEYEIRNNHSEFNEAIFTNEYTAEFLAEQFSPPVTGGMSPDQFMQGISFAIRSVNLWAAAETAYNNGMLTEDTYKWVFDDITQTLAPDPGIRVFYRYVLDVFPSQSELEVVKFAETYLQE